mmetsp:Transcript_33719/g.24376  ORF Transcript_33719/g.24376 Transcript_33719/m.24376 type:complete len:82 (-) Transcript_33719:560-805(-)
MSGHSDRSINLWNTNKSNIIRTFAGAHNREIFDIAIYKENDKFISCGGDKKVYIWDVIQGRPIRNIDAHTNRINSICINPL